MVPQYIGEAEAKVRRARGAGGARPRAARSGRAESVMDQGDRAAGRLDHQAQCGAGQLCAGRPSRSCPSSRRISGSPPTSRNPSSTACGPGQQVDISVDAYPAAEADRPRRQHPARLGLALHRLPAGERHRQLRQDRAARAGEDRDRQRTGSQHCRCRSAAFSCRADDAPGRQRTARAPGGERSRRAGGRGPIPG